MKLGERLRKMRLEAGLSQKEVAKRGGIDRTMVSKIEVRAQNPSLEILRRLAIGLGCSVVDLLDEEDKRPQRQPREVNRV
ncbi:MAG: helix-turn-helix domain-containing protein [Nitrososphaera sp.]